MKGEIDCLVALGLLENGGPTDRVAIAEAFYSRLGQSLGASHSIFRGLKGATAMGGGAVFGHGGRVQHIGTLNGYPEDWMASTKKTIEDELRSRGIAPETIKEVTCKIKEPPSPVIPVLLAIAATALICALIFVAIWENTP